MTPVEQPKKYKYRREISLVVTYNQPNGEGYQYKEWETIETDDVFIYAERKEKTLKEYEQLIKNIESTDVETLNKQKSEIVDFYRDLNKSIYESLNNTATDYINIGNTIIIKKSDFVNVALEIITR